MLHFSRIFCRHHQFVGYYVDPKTLVMTKYTGDGDMKIERIELGGGSIDCYEFENDRTEIKITNKVRCSTMERSRTFVMC